MREAPEGALFCPFCRTAIVPPQPKGEPPDPMVGQTIKDAYIIQERVGIGGMGRVYKAVQINLGRSVALKLLRPALESDPTILQRFHREARACSRLHHPNVIQVLDFGQAADGALFIVMEYVSGRSLFRVLRDESPLAEPRAIHLGAQVLSALAEAHGAGIVHRDLKPENVMVESRRDEPEFVKVLDFGIAKLHDPEAPGSDDGQLTKTGVICGTPSYMSPEQASLSPLDARSDLYSVGVILYEMLTGHLPFRAATPPAMAQAHVVEPPPPMSERCPPGRSVSPALEALVMKALEKNPGHRFQSAEEMRRALLACPLAPSPGEQTAPALCPASSPTQVEHPRVAPPPTGPVPAAPPPDLAPRTVSGAYAPPLPSATPARPARSAPLTEALASEVSPRPRVPAPTVPAPAAPTPATRAPAATAPSAPAPPMPTPAPEPPGAQACLPSSFVLPGEVADESERFPIELRSTSDSGERAAVPPAPPTAGSEEGRDPRQIPPAAQGRTLSRLRLQAGLAAGIAVIAAGALLFSRFRGEPPPARGHAGSEERAMSRPAPEAPATPEPRAAAEPEPAAEPRIVAEPATGAKASAAATRQGPGEPAVVSPAEQRQQPASASSESGPSTVSGSATPLATGSRPDSASRRSPDRPEPRPAQRGATARAERVPPAAAQRTAPASPERTAVQRMNGARPEPTAAPQGSAAPAAEPGPTTASAGPVPAVAPPPPASLQHAAFVTREVVSFQQVFGDPELRDRGRALVGGAHWVLEPGGTMTFAPVAAAHGLFPMKVRATREGNRVKFEGTNTARASTGLAYVRISGLLALGAADPLLTLDMEIGRALGPDGAELDPTYRARTRLRLAPK